MIENKFIRVQCPRCMKYQTTYSTATSKIKCATCNKLLVTPRGGRAKIKARIRGTI